MNNLSYFRRESKTSVSTGIFHNAKNQHGRQKILSIRVIVSDEHIISRAMFKKILERETKQDNKQKHKMPDG